MRPTLTLYYRQDCHLCDDMLRQLHNMRWQHDFELFCVDVDQDRGLAERYGTRVPVLAADTDVICTYYLDPVAVAGFLEPTV